MKKITAFAFALLCALLLSSCASTMPGASEGDVVVDQKDDIDKQEMNDGTEPTQIIEADSTAEGQKVYRVSYSPVDYDRKDLLAVTTPLDDLLQGREYSIKGIDTTQSNKDFYFIKDQQVKKDSQTYVLQFATLADFDEAQQKLNYLSKITGLSLKLSFSAPFYKIRSGLFESKEEAEQKLMELKLLEITAFIMKK